MTDDRIVFHEIKLPVNFLAHMHATHALEPRARELLQVAFDHGGYIAGGFAALCARHYVLGVHKGTSNPEEYFWASIRKHIGQEMEEPRIGQVRAFRNARNGDIDVWFASAVGLEGFLSDTRRLDLIAHGSVTVSSSATNTAIEHVVDNTVRVQAITRYLMPMKEQLERFDIYNAMVGLTNEAITVPENWCDLERSHILHVSSWKSIWTVGRCFKYMNRKGYSVVTPATAQHLVEETFKALEMRNVKDPDAVGQAIELAKTNRLFHAAITDPGRVQSVLSPLMKSLTAEQLLKLSALFKGCSTYDHAMMEIRRRIPLA